MQKRKLQEQEQTYQLELTKRVSQLIKNLPVKVEDSLVKVLTNTLISKGLAYQEIFMLDLTTLVQMPFESFQFQIDNLLGREIKVINGAEDLAYTEGLLAYFSNLRHTLVSYWGYAMNATKVAKLNKDDFLYPMLMAKRDYLEAVISVCKNKYDATSRMLTAFQAGQTLRTWRRGSNGDQDDGFTPGSSREDPEENGPRRESRGRRKRPFTD